MTRGQCLKSNPSPRSGQRGGSLNLRDLDSAHRYRGKICGFMQEWQSSRRCRCRVSCRELDPEQGGASVGVIQTCQVVQWREREEDDDDDDDEWTRGVALRGREDRGDDSTAPKLKVGGRHAPLVYRIYRLLWSSPLLQSRLAK